MRAVVLALALCACGGDSAAPGAPDGQVLQAVASSPGTVPVRRSGAPEAGPDAHQAHAPDAAPPAPDAAPAAPLDAGRPEGAPDAGAAPVDAQAPPDAQPSNSCGGSAELEAEPGGFCSGTYMGPCANGPLPPARWQCDGTDRVVCVGGWCNIP